MIRLAATGMMLCCLQGCSPQHCVVVQAEQVALVLDAPGAQKVQFASSLDQYNLHTPTQNKDGKWMIIMPSRQEFQYFYLVDGKPFHPECQYKEADDFGAYNCRYLP